MKCVRIPFALALYGFASLAMAAPWSVFAATFNLFSPATGVLVGSPNTYVTSSANSSHIVAMWSGTCNSTTFLRGDGSCVAVNAVPGGSDTQVQFNNAGAFAGDSGLTFNSGSDTLAVTGDVVVAGQSVCQENGTNCPPAGGTPGGSTTQVQFNNAGAFAGDSGLTYDSGADTLAVAGNITVAGQSVCQANGTNCPAASGDILIVKTANETRTATLLTVDSQLYLPAASVAINATYRIQAFLYINATAVNDIQFNTTDPPGAGWGNVLATWGAPAASAANAQYRIIGNNSAFIDIAADGIILVTWEGIIQTDGTAGDIGVRWGTLGSSAPGTTMNAGSYILVRRII